MKKYYEHQVIRDLEFSGISFSDAEFVECTFEKCKIENIQINDCKFTDCTFLKCRIINPVFENSSVTNNKFTECCLFGVNWSGLSQGVVAPIECLKNCQIKYNHFVDVNYSKFMFEGNDILDSLFADCNLSHSDFCRCNLDKTEFFRCNLKGASFENAIGYAVDISSCKLKGAVFSFPEAVNLLNGLEIIIK